MKLSRFEVSVVRKRSRYVATCSLFPDCKGTAHTEQDALDKLSSAIGRHIAATFTAKMSSAFSSDDYTEVISPRPQATDELTTKRIFSVESAFGITAPEAMPAANPMSLKSLPEDPFQEFADELKQHDFDMTLDEAASTLLTKGLNYRGSDDEGAFGILMSLN